MWALVVKEGTPYFISLQGQHGPLPHLLNVLAFRFFGDSDFSLRFFASLAGVGLLALLYPFRELLSSAGALGAALLLGISPLMVYYSRFAINEIFLVFFTLVMGLILYCWIFAGKKNCFFLVAAAWAFMVASKETWIINLPVILIALAVTYFLHKNELPPLKLGSWLTPKIFAGGMILSILIITATHTRCFTRFQDITHVYEDLSPWIYKGISGGAHLYPFSTYLTHLSTWELPILFMAVISLLLWFKFRDPLGTYLIFWACFSLLAYSLIEYKTPWLIINILLPWGLLAGRSLKYLIDCPLSTKKLILLIGCLLLGSFILSLTKTVELNYRRYDDPALWLVYSQEPRFIKKLYQQIFQVAMAQDNPQAVKLDIFLGPSEVSPTIWYLRRFPGKIFYNNPSEVTQAAVILFSDTTKPQVITQIKPENYETGRISSYPGVVLHLWVKKEAWELYLKKNSESKS